MPLPTKADILSNIQTLRSYAELYLNGQLTNEASIVLKSMGASSGGTAPVLPTFLPTSALSQVKEANDFQLILAYLDAGTPDERISTVKYRSVALASEYTDTSTYVGTPGNYRLTNLVRTFASI